MEVDAATLGKQLSKIGEQLEQGEIGIEAGASDALSALSETETEAGDVAQFDAELGDEAGAISRGLLALLEKGLTPEEVSNLVTALAYTQIQPGSGNYLDGGEEAVKATDIGRRILKRERRGGRPSKVEQGIEDLEDSIEAYSGEQLKSNLQRKLHTIRRDVSRPTWNKFCERADPVVEQAVGETVDGLLQAPSA